jgi:glyoxylase-like metal-dependent hydrolase (beta-lactamase superfamily II)/rhodanese-related sulfurtransferase
MDVPDRLVPLVDEGLGNSAYLLDLGEGRALAVDPSVDLRTVDRAAARRGLRITFAAETHLHADFLSGARQLAAGHGCRILASAAGGREFPHASLGDGDEVDLGGLTLRALETPGHTPEHLSYLILDGSTELAVFTGGSLIVGAAARTDLTGAGRTEQLARAQYRSLRRLAELPDATEVWPTHGAGSFCSAPPGPARTTTIGAEKATNSLLAAPDEDTFVATLLASLGSYPAYFDRLAEINRRGPDLITDQPRLVPLDQEQVRRRAAEGAHLLDVRPVADYAAGHIPGAISIPLRAPYATWLGWLLDPGTPVVVVRNPDQDPADILWPALAVGYPLIAGELAGGMPAWTGPVRTTRLVTPAAVDTPVVLDVRQASEHATGHLPGASLIELGDLTGAAGTVPAGPVTVMCGHGERAATAASLLERAGRTEVSVLIGGAADWAAATGRALHSGA